MLQPFPRRIAAGAAMQPLLKVVSTPRATTRRKEKGKKALLNERG